jgi:hypothetical protein
LRQQRKIEAKLTEDGERPKGNAQTHVRCQKCDAIEELVSFRTIGIRLRPWHLLSQATSEHNLASILNHRNLTRRQFMIRFKPSYLMLTLGLIAPLCGNAADYCIKVNNGFGQGGTSFIGKGFALPAAGACQRWSGFAKTASSVIAISTGTGCRSSDGKVLELTISSTDPSYLGSGVVASDHIKFCPGGTTNCPIGGGSAVGLLSNGPAKPQTCTATLLNLPAIHD